ncbi:MAG: prolyl oligopeptidase family serine peptidase, partial [Candidatus Aminicenantes bacterium]|nr:prolyl oligopeptidase family serine peptidase [Candidatus Aminicenantes bacterium]
MGGRKYQKEPNMRKIPIVLLVMGVVLGVLGAEEVQRRPMTVDDALNMIQIRNPLISPDGNWVFYSRSELDWDKNKRKTKYYMVSAQGGEPYQYIGEAGGSAFQFSPDGKFLSFRRTIDKFSQIFLMPTSGGEGIQLTKHKNSIGSYKWAPDSTQIFFVASEPRSKEEEKEYKAGNDAVFVDEGPNGQNQGSYRNLWVYDIKSKEETKLTDEKFLLGSFDVSPDRKQIIFTVRYSNRRNDGYQSELYLYDVEKKKKIRLTENNSPESSPVLSPDGKSFVYLAADDQEWLNRNSKLWLMDPVTKKHRLLSGKFEGSIRGATWTLDGHFLLFNGQQGTNSNLYRLEVASGQVTQLTHVIGTLRVSGFSRNRDKMVYSFTDFDTPSDLYSSVVDSFQPIRLTEGNPWVEKELLLASMEVIRWPSKNGFEIEGLFHLPDGHKNGTRIPLMVNIHGGPAGCFVNSFRSIYHIYAGLGYASLSPNVRGSSGYTDKLREGNTVQSGDGIGKGDYWDLMNGVDFVIGKGQVDPDFLALRGWSYGGILGGWTITQTDRFKSASIGAGVYDWTSEYGPGFNHDVRLWHIGGTPWENPQAWREQS